MELRRPHPADDFDEVLALVQAYDRAAFGRVVELRVSQVGCAEGLRVVRLRDTWECSA